MLVQEVHLCPVTANPLGHGILTPLGQAGELPSPPWTTRKRLLNPLGQARKLASPPGTASISTPLDNRGPLLPPLGQMSSVGGVCLLNGITQFPNPRPRAQRFRLR